MIPNDIALDLNALQKAFNRTSKTFDTVAELPIEICNRLIERLDFIRLKPQIILDIGAGTGYSTRSLKKKYPVAQLITLDFAEQTLEHQKISNPLEKNIYPICGDANYLPFADESFDLVFSNLLLPWTYDLEKIFREMHRVLKPNGLVLFSTLGPDTLKELRNSWAYVDDLPHVHLFFDLHDIGDELIHAQFTDPVMDVETLVCAYSQVDLLWRDLKYSGSTNFLVHRRKTLTGKTRFQNFLEELVHYQNLEKKLAITFEITYGHAWRVEKKPLVPYRIPVSKITRN